MSKNSFQQVWDWFVVICFDHYHIKTCSIRSAVKSHFSRSLIVTPYLYQGSWYRSSVLQIGPAGGCRTLHWEPPAGGFSSVGSFLRLSCARSPRCILNLDLSPLPACFLQSEEWSKRRERVWEGGPDSALPRSLQNSCTAVSASLSFMQFWKRFAKCCELLYILYLLEDTANPAPITYLANQHTSHAHRCQTLGRRQGRGGPKKRPPGESRYWH